MKVPADYGTDEAKAKHERIVREALSKLGTGGTGIDTARGKDGDGYARG